MLQLLTFNNSKRLAMGEITLKNTRGLNMVCDKEFYSSQK